MKKLIAILAILVVSAFFMTAAEKITNPFKFSLGANFVIKADNAYTAANIDANNANQDTFTNAKIGSAYLEFSPSASMSTTLAQIYTLSFNFGGRLRAYDPKGAKNEARFMFTWGNKISVIKDWLDINVDLGYNFEAGANFKTASWYEIGEAGGDEPINKIITKGKMITSLVPTASVGLSGKVGNTGFKWGVSETVIMQFISNFYKDNNPTMAGNGFEGFIVTGGIGTAGLSTVGVATDPQRDNIGSVLESVALQGKIDLQWEFFHFFAPENVTCTLKAPVTLGYWMPYSYALELSKEFTIDTTPGLEFNIAGIGFFAGVRSRTYFYYNTSAPLNGTMGSDWSCDGTKVLNARGGLAALGTVVTPNHYQNWWRGGPQVKFTLGKDWLTFSADWQGYWHDGAAYYDLDNPTTSGTDPRNWKNEFNIGCNIKL